MKMKIDDIKLADQRLTLEQTLDILQKEKGSAVEDFRYYAKITEMPIEAEYSKVSGIVLICYLFNAQSHCTLIRLRLPKYADELWKRSARASLRKFKSHKN